MVAITSHHRGCISLQTIVTQLSTIFQYSAQCKTQLMKRGILYCSCCNRIRGSRYTDRWYWDSITIILWWYYGGIATVLQWYYDGILWYILQWYWDGIAVWEDGGARQGRDGAAAERRKLTHYTDAPEKGGGKFWVYTIITITITIIIQVIF